MKTRKEKTVETSQTGEDKERKTEKEDCKEEVESGLQTSFVLYLGFFSTEIKVVSLDICNKSFSVRETWTDCCFSGKPGISHLLLRGDEKLLYAGAFDHRVRVFSVKSAKLLAVLRFNDGIINSLAARENTLLASSEDGYISIWTLY